MRLKLNQIKKPEYFHREYENDVKKRDPNDKNAVNQVLRVAQVALPFVALYKPFGKPLALLMGACRTVSCISKTYSDYSEGKGNKELALNMLQTTVAITSFAGTTFAHPFGTLVTTCHDLGINVIHLHQAWVENDSEKAIESGLQALNNSAYLGMLFVGSTEILVTSLALQILSGLYHTSGELKKSNYLEVGAGILIASIRVNQMVQPVSLLKARWKMETLTKKSNILRAIENNNNAKSEIPSKAVIDVLIKYGTNSQIPALQNAITNHDLGAVKILVENGADVNRYCNLQGTPLQSAFSAKDFEIVKYLHSNGACLDEWCFSIAVRSNFLESLDLLITNKVPLPPDSGYLLKILISKYNAPESRIAIIKLVNYGADCKYFEKVLTTYMPRMSRVYEDVGLLTDVIKTGDIELAKLFIKHGAPINYCMNTFISRETGMALYLFNPMIMAIQSGRGDIARLLLSNGAIASSVHWQFLESQVLQAQETSGIVERLKLILELKLFCQAALDRIMRGFIQHKTTNLNALDQLSAAGAKILDDYIRIASQKGETALIAWLLEKGAKP